MGDELRHGGVGILIKKNWSESVLSIPRVNHRIMILKMLIEKDLGQSHMPLCYKGMT